MEKRILYLQVEFSVRMFYIFFSLYCAYVSLARYRANSYFSIDERYPCRYLGKFGNFIEIIKIYLNFLIYHLSSIFLITARSNESHG